jgi:hypothetical protein
MFLIETGLVLLSFLIALIFPNLGSKWFHKVEGACARISRRKVLSVTLIGGVVLGVRLALLPIEPIPKPFMTDEFSYLLMADTFAHGRVTNPTHPMWTHFETFHVNQKPTYCSMYYPAQGLFLAVGQAIFGHPFWGVWLSMGLMSAAFCWALQGWMPASWAFLGATLAIIRLGTFSYWANSYWGGAVAAVGGALVLGAFPRIKRHPRPRHAVILGIGLAILGNSRPYESLLYAAPILLVLAFWYVRSKFSRHLLLRRVVLPLAIVLVVALSAMGYYFWRCSGSPFKAPYLTNLESYQIAPLFAWQKIRSAPHYRDQLLKSFYSGWPVEQYREARYHPAAHLVARSIKAGLFFVGPALALPWLVLLGILPAGLTFRQLGHKTGLMLAICAATIVGLSLPVGFESHYAAPACCAFYALEVQALRRIRLWDLQGKRRGHALARYLVTACILLLVVRIFVAATNLPIPREFARTWVGTKEENFARAAILESLSGLPGQHLILTHYSVGHDPNIEWVYNSADIDDSKVVWARDMGSEQNLEIIRYFRNRRVWALEADLSPPKISPYEDSQRELLKSSP